MKDGEILKTLQRAVMAARIASSIVASDFPIKFIGSTSDGQGGVFAIPDDQKWIELVFLPNNENAGWGNETNYRGTLRVILHWPNDGRGPYEPLSVLGSIAGYFTKDLFLQDVQIYDTAKLTGALESGTETLYPASIRYQSFRQE